MSNDSVGNRVLPLSGVRVLDLTRVLAGPFCTMILADLGAEVVKIERPNVGDDARRFGPFLPSGRSAYFDSVNRGKKSVVLDLKVESDRRTFERLVERADVLVENFRPGTMDGFQLGAARLRTLNPRLIYAAATGFGQTGPQARRAAYDIIIQAMSGLMSITGDGAGHSVRVGTSISDLVTGLFTTIGIVAALRERGQGCELDLSMLDCSVAVLENAISRFEVTGQCPVPLGTRHPSITPFQAFTTADSALVVAAGNDGLWRKLCDALDCRSLADDPQFCSNDARTRNRAELEALLGECFRREPTKHWLARLDKAGIPAAPIRSIDDVVHDPHLQARGMIHEMQSPVGERFRTAGSPLFIDGQPLPVSSHAPELGEHTQSVLADWLSDA